MFGLLGYLLGGGVFVKGVQVGEFTVVFAVEC